MMDGIEWNERGFLSALEAAVGVAEKEAAEAIEKQARKFLAAAKGHGDDVPHLEQALKVVKSKAPKKAQWVSGGYTVGVFDAAPPAKWEDSVGARAVFFEYGHAAPGGGRGSVKRSQVVKVTAPNSFLKAAQKKTRATARRLIQEALE